MLTEPIRKRKCSERHIQQMQINKVKIQTGLGIGGKQHPIYRHERGTRDTRDYVDCDMIYRHTLSPTLEIYQVNLGYINN